MSGDRSPVVVSVAPAVEEDSGHRYDHYIDAHADLAIWRSIGGNPDPAAHFRNFGQAEGRRVPEPQTVPVDWSDALMGQQDAELRELRELGLVPTLFWNACAQGDPSKVKDGLVSTAAKLWGQINVSTALGAESVVECLETRGPTLLDCVIKRDLLVRWSEEPRAHVVNDYIEREVPTGSFDVVICVHWLETGGAELEALWFYRACVALGLNPLMILVDSPAMSKFYQEQNLNYLSFPSIVQHATSRPIHEMPMETRSFLLGRLLKHIDGKLIHVCNSYTSYWFLRNEKHEEFLSVKSRCVIAQYCPHVHKDGRMTGYMKWLPDILPQINGILTDTLWYKGVLARDYAVPSNKIHALAYPAPSPPKAQGGAVSERSNQYRRVLWASRLDFQKNPSILFDIAKLMPNVSFDIWGRVVLSDVAIDWNLAPENVFYRGEFTDPFQLPLREYDAFLYTSLFDGLPNILLEMVMAELPIVSSDVGGIAELLGAGRGELVADAFDVNGYVAGLNRVLADVVASKKRAASLAKSVRQERSFQAFCSALAEVPSMAALFAKEKIKPEAR